MAIVSCSDLGVGAVAQLAQRFGLTLVHVPPNNKIPGSYWGEPEAGLVGPRLYVRGDTPVHSALHEACHFICMDEARRAALDKDAGGDTAEESAVCYLQVLLADHLPGYGKQHLFADLDAWGYSFRLGSALCWFDQDAEDARLWLLEKGLIDDREYPKWRVRRQ